MDITSSDMRRLTIEFGDSDHVQNSRFAVADVLGCFGQGRSQRGLSIVLMQEDALIIRDVIWKKSSIPFGTAAVTSSVRLDRDGFPSYTYVRRLWLSDHGTSAKSKIPEAK